MMKMTLAAISDAILYYIFHLIYLGYPADILSRLWLAHDVANCKLDAKVQLSHHRAWQTFDDSMRESYRTIGTLVRVSNLKLLQRRRVQTIRLTRLVSWPLQYQVFPPSATTWLTKQFEHSCFPALLPASSVHHLVFRCYLPCILTPLTSNAIGNRPE